MRKKETKPRTLKKGCGRWLFIEKFGKPIEEYESFQRCVEGAKESTKFNYNRVLPAYFLFLAEDPDSVLANRKADLISSDAVAAERYERKTKAYIQTLIANNMTVSGPLGRIHGFFSNNSRRLRLELGNMKYPKARKKRKFSPSNEDVQKLIGNADNSRDKFIVAVMNQNGPTPVDVAALCIGDYPEEAWCYFEISRSKTGAVWRGISTPDVCEFLKAYLVVRKGKVGDPLLVGREGPLDNEAVSQTVRSIIVKSDFGRIPGFTPKCLRDGFEDALCDAEIYHKVKESLMGHTVDIEHEYGSFNKMVDRLTEAMKKTYPLLCLNDLNRAESSILGLTKEDIENVKEIANNIELYREISDLLKAKKLVHIDDPELAKRLKEEGKI